MFDNRKTPSALKKKQLMLRLFMCNVVDE